MPFYFMYRSVDGQYKLNGEGNGDKSATKPAFEELKTYDETKLLQIVAETKLAPEAQNLKTRETK